MHIVAERNVCFPHCSTRMLQPFLIKKVQPRVCCTVKTGADLHAPQQVLFKRLLSSPEAPAALQMQAMNVVFCRCLSACLLYVQQTCSSCKLTNVMLLCRCKPCSSCCGHRRPAGSRRCSGLPGSRASSSARTQGCSGVWCSVKGDPVASWQLCRCKNQPFARQHPSLQLTPPFNEACTTSLC